MARVKLGLRNLSINETIMKGIMIIYKMQTNPYLHDPIPSIAEIQTALDELRAATAACSVNNSGLNLSIRNRKKEEFLAVIRKLGGWISSQTTDKIAIASTGFDYIEGAGSSRAMEQTRSIRADFEYSINTLKIIWQPVPQAKQYLVEMSPRFPYGENAQWSLAGYTTRSKFNANETLLKPLTQYFFRVRALGTSGIGPPSSIVKGAIF